MMTMMMKERGRIQSVYKVIIPRQNGVVKHFPHYRVALQLTNTEKEKDKSLILSQRRRR